MLRQPRDPQDKKAIDESTDAYFLHNGAFRLSYGFEYAYMMESSYASYIATPAPPPARR